MIIRHSIRTIAIAGGLLSLTAVGTANAGPGWTKFKQAQVDSGSPAPTSPTDAAAKIKEQIAQLEARVKNLLEPAQWVIKTGSGTVESGSVHKLCNTHDGLCLGWKKQPYGTGINLAWHDVSADKQARLVKAGGGAIKYGDTVALFVGQTSDSYLCYKVRDFGINLDWSTKPCYQWRIDSPPGTSKSGESVAVDAPFVLVNTTENDSMVRCAREKSAFQGAWLKWRKTCSTLEIAYTNKDLAKKLYEEIKALKDKL